MEDKLKKKETVVNKLIKSGGVVTDREMPIALLGIAGIEDYKIESFSDAIRNEQTLRFLNMVTHMARDKWRSQMDIKDGDEIPEMMLHEIWSDVPNMFNMVAISEYEARKFFEERFGKKIGDSAQVYKHMMSIADISLKGTLRIYYDKDGDKRWREGEVKGAFAEVWCTTDKGIPEWFGKERSTIKKGKFKGKEKRIYVVRFIGTWGFNFVLNILNDRIRILPKRFGEALSNNASLLFRIIAGRKNERGTTTIQGLRELFSWEGDWGNISKQISAIDKIWKELNDWHFTSVLNKKGKGENTVWTFERIKGWFYMPKELEAEMKMLEEKGRKS